MMTGFVVTLQDMRSTEVKDVRMYAVSRQAAADGARGQQDVSSAFAVVRVVGV